MPRSAADVEADLTLWRAARNAVATGQSYSVNGRSLSRASLRDINDIISDLNEELRALSGTRITRGRVLGY